MAKKHALSLIFTIFHLFLAFVQANNGEPLPHSFGFFQDECTAAPPNNFRVTAISTNFIALAWEPISSDAKHTLVISQKNESGVWVHVKTIYELTGNTYIVDELQSGTQHRVAISTNCPTGETSEYAAIQDPITLIVDLTIEGRTPIKPIPVPCDNVPVDKNWIGFRVDHIVDEGSESNTFEFVYDNSGNTSLKRVTQASPIVAAEKLNWPNCNVPTIFGVGSPYQIVHVSDDGQNNVIIGYVSAILHDGPQKIEMCPILNHPQNPWDGNYIFTALFAEKATPHDDCSGNPRTKLEPKTKLHVQNPFNENLKVFLGDFLSLATYLNIRLLNINGQVLLTQRFEGSEIQSISFSTLTLPKGIYILQIESEEEVLTFKLTKSR